jgi:hypothetical protein
MTHAAAESSNDRRDIAHVGKLGRELAAVQQRRRERKDISGSLERSGSVRSIFGVSVVKLAAGRVDSVRVIS